MADTLEANDDAPTLAARRRWDLAPLAWIGVALACLAVELVAVRFGGDVEVEPGPRAVWLVGATLVLALAVLLGVLLAIALPTGGRGRLRRAVALASIAVFGLATLAVHGWALRVIFARVRPPSAGWLRLDPIVDVVGGLYVAVGWVIVLAGLVLAARLGAIVARRRAPGRDHRSDRSPSP